MVDLNDNKGKYGAGEPWPAEAEIEVPEFVTSIRDQLQEVRTAIGTLEDQLWPRNMYRRPMVEQLITPEPLLRIQINTSLEPLRKEEDRLMSELRDLEWIIPPLMLPPHNGKLTATKAKKILADGSVNGHPLTDAQKRFFGAVAGGEKPYAK
jgi:hypothetical protein